MEVELAILNYNGRCHLEHLLPTAIAEASILKHKCRVVVLDNGSSYEELQWIASTFPMVDVISTPGNDYLFSYNWYARETEAEVLVLLNNDLKLCEGFLTPLLAHFALNDVFSVSATSRNWENTTFTFGPIQLKHHHGAWYWQPEFEKQETSATLFTSGGFMAVDRKKFLEIGGFDRFYYPAYCEDLDLCFRAWKKGWSCIFEPTSVVLHRENGSWAQNGNERAKYLQTRAGFMFAWRNLPNACSFTERFSFFLFRLVRALTAGEFWYLRAWVGARKGWRNSARNSRCDQVSHEFIDLLEKKLNK
jgi:GT2 family glycosyltransferase